MKKLDFIHFALPWLGVTLLFGGLLPFDTRELQRLFWMDFLND